MASKRSKHHLSYTIRDFEKEYQKYMKAEKGKEAIPTVTYRALMKDFFMELSKAIIRKKYTFRIPYRIGEIRIVKRKTHLGSEGSINWGKSREKKKTIYHLNRHSNGYFFRWKWKRSNKYALFTNSTYYQFFPVRGTSDTGIGKKGLSDWILKCAKDPMVRDYDVLI